MSRINTEYTKASVGSAGCTYATLQGYNQNYNLSTINVGAPVVSSARSNEIVIVPSYGGVGYSSLSASQGRSSSCTGYPSVKYAYPLGNNSCNLFTGNLN